MDGIREYSESITDAEILDDAYKYFEQIQDDENEMRELMARDAEFIEDHWDEKIRKQRSLELRPALQVPRLNQFLNQVKNEQRQNKPAIKVSPVDDGADIKAAENRQGVIRHIQYDSCATDAYQMAYDYAVDLGRGFFRIRTDYVSDKTFDQKIIIDAIPRPLQVYMGRHEKQDYSDSKQGFILEDITKEVFKARWPKADPSHWDTGQTDRWMREKDLSIAEFYCVWTKKRTLVGLPDGTAGYLDELEGDNKTDAEQLIKREEASTREVLEPYIMWYKMTRREILDRKHIPGKFIPIIPVIGIEKYINGRLFIKGMVRDSKDIQRMLDYWVSSEAEHLTLSIKAQWIVAKGQFENYKGYWENANTENYAFLPYQPTSHDGKLVPPPQKQMPPPVPMGFVQAKAGCVDDMKAVTGIWDAGLGNRSNETSGRAILARQRESDTANYHYLDNLRMALTHAGKIINDWLPTYYDGNRIVRIMGAEDEEKELELGGRDEEGKEITLGSGTYDVTVTMGASFNTKRQEAVESMMEFLRVVPSATPLVYDLFVKNMDWPGAQEISERLRKTVPPELLENESSEAQLAQMYQKAMQQNQQSQQVIEEMSQQLEQVMEELSGKKLDAQTKIQVENIKAKAKLTDREMQILADQDQSIRESKQKMWETLQQSPNGVQDDRRTTPA